MKRIILSFPLIAALAIAPLPAQARDQGASAAISTAVYAPIGVAEVEAAQRAWGDALIAISIESDTKGHAAAKKMAGDVIDTAYAYDMGPVLFKPTLTSVPQTFRTTREGALAYFVGGDKNYPTDTGFALKHWRKYQIDNAGILITGNSAISMGKVTLWDSKGNMTTVDKTWGFVRGDDGKLLIILHHSSLPYSPETKTR